VFQNRAPGRKETLLADTASGATNLAAGTNWFSAGPVRDDEVWRVTTLDLTIAGPGLLENLRGFGGAGGKLEIGFDMHDGFGTVRDIAPLFFHSIAEVPEWSSGSSAALLVDPEAGRYSDGRPRAGVRGDARSTAAAATWSSEEIELRYGKEVHAAVWHLEPLRNPAGDVLDVVRLDLEAGVVQAGGNVQWSTHGVIASTQDQEPGSRTFTAPVVADRIRWQLRLQFADVTEASYDASSVRRTAKMLQLGVWAGSSSPWWHLHSLAELIHRGEADRELRTKGWDGTQDVCVIRLPVSTELRGKWRERLKARLIGAGSALSLLEAHAVTDIYFLPPE
jgi:hypothetical protein